MFRIFGQISLEDMTGLVTGLSRLSTLLLTFNLEDFYRVSFPSGRPYTWFNRAHTIGCRLDRFYTPRARRYRIGGFHDSPFVY